MINKDEILQRRQRLLAPLPVNSAVIIPAASEQTRNRDVHYPFRQDSHYYYLTGDKEPDAVMLLFKGEQRSFSTVFVHERDFDFEQWMGERLGPERAAEHLAVDEAYPLAQVDQTMPEILKQAQSVYYPFFQNESRERQLRQWLAEACRKSGRTGTRPCQLNDVAPILGELRLYKSPAEIEKMRQAASISAGAHKRAMRSCKPGMAEFELEAEIIHEFKRHGAFDHAYNPIVASGKNACILHYENNDRHCCDGELMLIDAGVECDYYASDITRTFPVNGRFTERQKAIYDIVLQTQRSVIDKIAPGVKWNELHQLSASLLTQGLHDLGVLNENVEVAIEHGSYRRYYPHGFGHWLGLDVHDVGSYQLNGQWRELEPGMTFTVEPGLYFGEFDQSPYQGIGVRIEDDVLVTDNGCEVLTAEVPKEIEAIEALMAESVYES